MDAATVVTFVGFTLALAVATVVSLGFQGLRWAVWVVCTGVTSSYVAWLVTHSVLAMLATEPTTTLSNGMVGVTCDTSSSIEPRARFAEMASQHGCREMTSDELLRYRAWNQNNSFEFITERAAFSSGFAAALLAAFLKRQRRRV